MSLGHNYLFKCQQPDKYSHMKIIVYIEYRYLFYILKAYLRLWSRAVLSNVTFLSRCTKHSESVCSFKSTNINGHKIH